MSEHDRVDVLNALVSAFKVRRYLEVGVWRGETFRDIKCADKTGVDCIRASAYVTHVMPSAEFFASTEEKWELIFVDGSHEEVDVYDDVLAALAHLTPGGVVAMHDINPANHGMAKRGLCGTAWRAFVRLRAERSDLEMFAVDIKHGVGVVRSGAQKTINLSRPFTFAQFDAHRKDWLSLKRWDEFQVWLAGAHAF